MEGLVFPTMGGEQEAQAVLATEEAAAAAALCQAAEPAAEKNGVAMFVVSNHWFSSWCHYSGFAYDAGRKKAKVVPQQEPGPRPGPIDNSDLLAAPLTSSDLTSEQQAGVTVLRDKLVDRQHLWVVHEPTWNLLRGWYSCQGPEIRRQYHLAGRRMQLDVHQQHFRVIARPPDVETVVGCSAMCTLVELKAMACAALGLDPAAYDVYDYRRCQQGDNLEASCYKTLTGNKLQDQQALLLLPKAVQPSAAAAAADAVTAGPASSPVRMVSVASPLRLSPRGSGGFTSPMSPLSRSFDHPPVWADDVVFEAPGRTRGLAGLGNLGNTCFMNSSLQCLAHSLPLMQTFLTGAYKRDLNKDNPLSLGGKLALAFGALMEKLWRGGVAHVSPKLFKWQLSKFAPQFSGFAQQDSQELLAFLLDGLHEDLNRITDKPYVEDKDSDGRPDEEVAAEAWANYRRRNDSVLVDTFQFLYRSVLTCPQCSHQSVKFDPSMYLSLPLPSSKMRSFTFTAIHADGSALPRQYGVEVPKSATVGQLYAAITELLGLATEAPEEVLLFSQFSFGDASFAIYDDLKVRVSSIDDLRPRSLFHRGITHLYVAYIYRSAEVGPRGGGHPVHVYHRARSGRSDWLIPATPFFIAGEQLAALSTEPHGMVEHLIAPGGGRDAIDAALEQLLRPFCKQAAQRGASAACSGGLVATASGADGAAAEPAPAVEASTVLASAEAMDVEQNSSPADTLVELVAAEPVSQAPTDEAWLASVPAAHAAGASVPSTASPQAAQDSDAPFDMWSAQNAERADAAAASSNPPFVLKAAKRSSYTGLSTHSAKLEVAESGEPLLLVAEWQEPAAQLYDPSPLLAAEQDASALALADKQRDGGKSVSLADCLETFLQPEQLDEDDRWYCGKCKQHVRADKKLDLWSLPDVLVVHLKRFSYSRYSRDKLDTLVDFPLRELDMSPYLLSRQTQPQKSDGALPSMRYDLFAVSNHFGGMGGGHYTAYCRVPGRTDGRPHGGWHTFDDSHVGPMEEGGVKTPAAYVLFYRRQRAEGAEDLEALLEQADAEAREAAASEGGDFGPAPPLPPLLSTPTCGSRQETIAEEGEEGEHELLLIPGAGAIDL